MINFAVGGSPSREIFLTPAPNESLDVHIFSEHSNLICNLKWQCFIALNEIGGLLVF